VATIVKPQVDVFQEFSLSPSEVTNPLRGHISGPNAMLHRYDVADEKADINVGEYDHLAAACYPWPGRKAGSLVDADSVRLFIDSALLLYHEDLIGDTSHGRGTVTPVSGHTNRIKSSTLSYKANGTDHPRSGLFKDRDVAIGDRVYIRGVDNAETTCEEIELWTNVAGFVADQSSGQVLPATEDAHNGATTTAHTSISQVDGPSNCITATANGSLYNGLADGYVCETYTIEVVKSSVAGCNAARLRVISASGTDNATEVEVAAFGSPTTIGSRGLTITFHDTHGPTCAAAALAAGVPADELAIGQKWEVTVCQNFERVCASSEGSFSGDFDDTYIITVTKGGKWAALPEITVTTAKGLDQSGPTVVTGARANFPVGSWDVAIRFLDCFNSNASEAAFEGDPFGGDSALAGLRKGDKFYIPVVSGQNGAIHTLILRDDLPDELADATDLDLRLFITKNIEVTANRLSDPPLTNYAIESTQLCTEAGVTAYDASWTLNGVEQALPVWGGTLYIEYREFLTDLVNTVGFGTNADIDAIPGQLDPANPLKWGFFRATQNSNGTLVAYTAVADPSSLDSWAKVIERIDGRDDLYNFVPLTHNREVQNLFEAQVDKESSPEAGNWKAMFVGLQAKTAKLVVGQSSANAQLLTPTSLDGDVVLAVLEDNPQASGTQYTRLRVPAANAGFLTYEVQAGDIVRYLYTIDAFGAASYTEFVVDSVLSENTLLLLSGNDVPITVPQKIEIWHTLSKDEIIADLKDQAQSFANRRVCAVWPDLVGTGGTTQDGYFLCAALAGLVSGVLPHQPVTNVEIIGFDDLASRTTGFFSGTQLDSLDDGGVWICTEDRDGTPHTRHALTTDVTDLKHWEESIRRNLDSISYLFLTRLRPFIGRSNVTPVMLRKLNYEVAQVIKFLKVNGFTEDLGAQIVDGVIRDGYPAVHPLLADRVEIVIDLTLPAPLNNIGLHLVV
jgi:hypothetical protein